eukprot:PITA_21876
MPFGLMNAGATFQRAMDISFVGEKDKFVLIYLDDITVYSSSHQDHLQHLKKVFLKCRRFGISVNPKKSQFALEEGKLFGHVVSTADEEGSKHPVAFFSKNLRDAELRYEIIEKQAYALIKSLKAFRVYILHSKIIAYVPSATIKDVLTQPDADGRRAKWIAKLIEFNIELKPTKLVRENGQTEEEEAAGPERKQLVAENLASCEWYSAIVKFLLKLEIPSSFTQSQGRTIKLRAAKYCINENLIYWRDLSGVLLRCLDKEQSIEFKQQFQSSMCGRHHYWKTIAHKILRAGFGCPHKLVTDNAAAFIAKELVEMCDSMGIKLVHSTPYYPQGNGLVESSNENLIRIIKKLLGDNKKNFDSKLKYALWADRVTIKKSTGNSPFKLVYGTEAVFPI